MKEDPEDILLAYMDDVFEDASCNLIHSHDKLKTRIPLRRKQILDGLRLMDEVKEQISDIVIHDNVDRAVVEFLKHLVARATWTQHNQCDGCGKQFKTALGFHRHYQRCTK